MRPKPIKPGPGQESVWDYPRPPRVEPSSHRIRVVFNGEVIAESTRAFRVLETSHPPGFYLPPEDVRSEFLRLSTNSSACEWKGRARYHHAVVGDRRAEDVAWSYPNPVAAFESIRDYITFYPGRVDACYVDEQLVTRRPAVSTAAGLLRRSLVPSKGAPGRGAGDGYPDHPFESGRNGRNQAKRRHASIRRWPKNDDA